MEAAGPSQVELEVLGWFKDWIGFPPDAAGSLVSGGSAGNMTALACARETLAGPMRDDLVLYVSDQAHSSIARAARILGFRPEQVRVLPSDDAFRLAPATVAAAMEADLARGLTPFAVAPRAGRRTPGRSTRSPSSPRSAASTAPGCTSTRPTAGSRCSPTRSVAGLEQADSVTLDPHKWLYQPFECGCVLVRDGSALRRAFEMLPDYLHDAKSADGEVNFSDLGLQLTRSARALKLWVSLRYFGVDAFREAIRRTLEIAAAAARRVEQSETLEPMAPPSLGVVCFRRRDLDDEANAGLAAALERSGTGLISTTRLHGRFALRLCVLNHQSTEADVEAVLAFLETAEPEAREPERERHPAIVSSWPGLPEGDVPSLRALPLFAGLEPAQAAQVASRAAVREAAAGEDVIEQWSLGSEFFVILEGTAAVSVDGQPARELGPGDFFGELRALEWGAATPTRASRRCEPPRRCGCSSSPKAACRSSSSATRRSGRDPRGGGRAAAAPLVSALAGSARSSAASSATPSCGASSSPTPASTRPSGASGSRCSSTPTSAAARRRPGSSRLRSWCRPGCSRRSPRCSPTATHPDGCSRSATSRRRWRWAAPPSRCSPGAAAPRLRARSRRGDRGDGHPADPGGARAALARTPDELTATNVVSGWIESLSVLAAPALAGVLLAVASPGWVFAVMALVAAASALLVARVHGPAPACDALPAMQEALAGFRVLAREPSARVLVGLLGGQFVAIGALDVLYVVLAISVLDLGGSGAGYLNAAFGAGGVAGIAVTVALVGRRRLLPPLVLGVLVGALRSRCSPRGRPSAARSCCSRWPALPVRCSTWRGGRSCSARRRPTCSRASSACSRALDGLPRDRFATDTGARRAGRPALGDRRPRRAATAGRAPLRADAGRDRPPRAGARRRDLAAPLAAAVRAARRARARRPGPGLEETRVPAGTWSCAKASRATASTSSPRASCTSARTAASRGNCTAATASARSPCSATFPAPRPSRHAPTPACTRSQGALRGQRRSHPRATSEADRLVHERRPAPHATIAP